MNQSAQDDIPVRSRLGDCEVCAKAAAKYTCPECEVKTCSLPCVKIHKAELDCDGIRSRVKFRRLSKFTNLDILSDYRLLEETNRAVSAAKKVESKILYEHGSYYSNKRKGQTLIKGALKKEVGLKLLPPNFTKHRTNTTRYDWKANEFQWKVKFIFRQADDCEFEEQKVSDKLPLGDIILKYLDPEKFEDQKIKAQMTPYNHRELHRLEVLLPAQGVPGNKFFLMNTKETIAENLKYKNVIEFPTFHVILEEKLSDYKIVHIVAENKNLLECHDDEADSGEDMENGNLA